jgi:hypothetical protein
LLRYTPALTRHYTHTSHTTTTTATTDTQLCASQGGGKSSANLNALDESKEGEDTTATTANATSAAVLTEVPLSDAPSLQRNRSQSSSVVQMEEKRVELTKKQAKAAKSDLPLAPLSRLWGLNKPDAFYVLVGLAGAFITGSLFPIEGIVIANIQVHGLPTIAFSLCYTAAATARLLLCVALVLLLIVALHGSAHITYHYTVSIAG